MQSKVVPGTYNRWVLYEDGTARFNGVQRKVTNGCYHIQTNEGSLTLTPQEATEYVLAASESEQVPAVVLEPASDPEPSGEPTEPISEPATEEVRPQEPEAQEEPLEDKTVKELEAMAKEKGLDIPSSVARKGDLVKYLKENGL